jgi:hypothetical protein
MENKDRVIFLQMDAYQPPDPTEVVTNFSKWVKYGSDNAYLEYLLARYYGSPTNSAIITGVSDMIIGRGLYSNVATKRPDSYAKAVVMFQTQEVRRWAFDLKCFGYFLMQVIKSKDGYICKHTPVENWRSGIANDKGEIDEWFYSDNWQKSGQSKYIPKSFPAYKKDIKANISIKAVKPFRAGAFYYPSPDYVGSLAYAHLEEEIATFHLNNVLNGFVPGYLINFNNGDPGPEERSLIEGKIQSKFTGSHNAGKFVLSFNDNKESAANIESVPVSDLDKQFQFLTTECSTKVLLGHRIVSPLLFGIRDSSGLGNNAQELTEAYKLFNAIVLDPYRKILIDAFEEVLGDIGISIPLIFRDNAFFDTEQKTTALSHVHPEMSEDQERVWLEHLDKVGELINPEEWDLVLEEAVDTTGLSLSDLDGSPSEKSSQDKNKGLYKVRYAYSPPRTQSDSRQFCKQMVERATSGMVYRKEDIIQMQASGVNSEFSAKGEDTYSIWLYKGGVNCHHYWNRRVYFRRRDPSGKFLPASETDDLGNDKPVSVASAKSAGVTIEPNEPEVPIAPWYMPKHGRK